MKDTIKRKMIKEQRPKFNTDILICECINCDWEGDIEKTKINDYGNLLCPDCNQNILIYQN